MRALLPAVCLLALPASGIARETAREIVPKKRASLTFLPHGSELKNVMFPRYDREMKLTGTLTADAMTLVDDDRIAARNVNIEFYHKDQTPRGFIKLPTARINQGTGFLHADSPVSLESDRLKAAGSSLVYDYTSGEAFLNGPGSVLFIPEHKTAMHQPPASPFRATLMAGFVLTTSAVTAEETPPAGTHAKGTAQTRTSVAADLEDSLRATQSAKDFFTRSGAAGNEGPAPVSPPDKPLEIPAAAQGSRITFDGGAYSDLNEGVIVFLKNVRVEDPRFELSGANELKVFLTPKKNQPQKEKDAAGEASAFGGLGGNDVDKIIATGAVRVKQGNVQGGKPPVEASGAVFTYHPKSGTLTLHGGFPWVIQGGNYYRSREADATIRIEKNGDFHISPGKSDMGGKIEKKP